MISTELQQLQHDVFTRQDGLRFAAFIFWEP
jgi:hypothetical protein